MTLKSVTALLSSIFLLTHPVWDVTHSPVLALCLLLISTHTSRVGCDVNQPLRDILDKFLLTHPVWDVTNKILRRFSCLDISTHTSRVGCDAFPYRIGAGFKKFLLTHPVWDVTRSGGVDCLGGNFYSHIPCGM